MPGILSIDEIPQLSTNRLQLCALSAEVFPLYREFYTDPEASRFYSGPISEAAAWSRLSADLGSWFLQGFGVWAIRRKADQRYLGVCGFWQGLGWPRELTWWLSTEARGQGYALEASRAAIRHAYQVWQWSTVQTYMNDDNLAAQALVQRLGGIAEQRQTFVDGLSRQIYRLPLPADEDVV